MPIVKYQKIISFRVPEQFLPLGRADFRPGDGPLATPLLAAKRLNSFKLSYVLPIRKQCLIKDDEAHMGAVHGYLCFFAFVEKAKL